MKNVVIWDAGLLDWNKHINGLEEPAPSNFQGSILLQNGKNLADYTVWHSRRP